MGELEAVMTGWTRLSEASLSDAFREDHARLGRGFFELSARLRENDVTAACAVAEQIDVSAGAHIAFEEEDFYPRLASLIGPRQVDRMLQEHRAGLDVVGTLVRHDPRGPLDEATRRRLVVETAAMSDHIAECGELFGTLGRVRETEQLALLERLLEWRRRRPRWTSYAARRDAAGGAR